VFDYMRDEIREAYDKHNGHVKDLVAESFANVDLNGKWSVDVLVDGKNQYWIIDMALAGQSAYWKYDNND